MVEMKDQLGEVDRGQVMKDPVAYSRTLGSRELIS